MTILDQTLLDILVCPVSKKPLEYDKEANELISKEAGLAYPVKAVSYTHLTLPMICSV